jgi:hypothetical protein
MMSIARLVPAQRRLKDASWRKGAPLWLDSRSVDYLEISAAVKRVTVTRARVWLASRKRDPLASRDEADERIFNSPNLAGNRRRKSIPL